MDFYGFMSESPYLTFFLAFLAFCALRSILVYCINRPLRHKNIRLHGWPPKHCDADGNFKSEKVENTKCVNKIKIKEME